MYWTKTAKLSLLMIVSLCISLLFCLPVANALTINATTLNDPLAVGDSGDGWKLVAFGDQTSQKQINDAIDTFVTLPELYKQDAGGGESGSLADSYSVEFTPASDPENAEITYDGGIAFDSDEPSHLLVKDGNNKPAWYLFELIGWDGMETINLVSFWAGNGGISHVSLYGVAGDGTIPEPSSMVIWSTMLLAGLVVSWRRRRKA